MPEDQDHALRTQEQSFEVEKVLDHKGKEGARHYLVKWKGFAQEHNSWEPVANFDDLSVIADYWRVQAAQGRQAKDASRGPSRERKGSLRRGV